jgi:AcrR family transcriptional regulator
MAMKRKVTAENRAHSETVARLLDAAERLFGEHGFDGVGMRALAAEAKVNLGAATYHFRSKENLYIETFLRRFRPANAERLRLLREAEVEADGRPLDVEKIVECMVRPAYLLGQEHPEFQTLLTRSLFLPPLFLQAALHQELKPNVEVFIAALCRALPHIPENLVRLREMFSMGAMLTFSMCVRGATPREDWNRNEGILSELIRFIAAGLWSSPATAATATAFFYPPKP